MVIWLDDILIEWIELFLHLSNMSVREFRLAHKKMLESKWVARLNSAAVVYEMIRDEWIYEYFPKKPATFYKDRSKLLHECAKQFST